MASLLHGSAQTTPRVRSELQEAEASSRSLARQYGFDPKTVLRKRKRTTRADAPMGPAKPRSTTLTEASIAVAFRERTLLSLDDMLGCLKDSIAKLTRSALHRCLVRNGISRFPKTRRAARDAGRSRTPRSATSRSTAVSYDWLKGSFI